MLEVMHLGYFARPASGAEHISGNGLSPWPAKLSPRPAASRQMLISVAFWAVPLVFNLGLGHPKCSLLLTFTRRHGAPIWTN